MKVFICTLLFMLMMFLNSVQSMDSSIYRTDKSDCYHYESEFRPRRAEIGLYVGQTVCFKYNNEWTPFKLGPCGGKQVLDDASYEWSLWEQKDFISGTLDLMDGDLLFRARKPIAKCIGDTFVGTNPRNLGRIEKPIDGDLLFRIGIPIGKYEKKVLRRIEITNWEYNGVWEGNIKGCWFPTEHEEAHFKATKEGRVYL